jgi:hypothetical protein
MERAALSAPEKLGHDGACPSMASAICQRVAAEIMFARSEPEDSTPDSIIIIFYRVLS